MGHGFSQVFPPAPALTERNVPSQHGKVFIVTGGYSGVGEALVSILYGAGATVYIAGRSAEKAQITIDNVLKAHPAIQHQSSGGRLEFLNVDFSDLTTIRPAVEAFTKQESKLDVLVNNAAINMTPVTSKTAQGHELIMGTNCVGPLLFTMLLLPSLKSAVSQSPRSSTRVVWAASQVVDFSSNGGIVLSDLDNPRDWYNDRYTNSKVGNWFLASEFAKRYGEKSGILSISQNPGALKTNLMRHGSWWIHWFIYPLLHDAKYGAYTELFCAVDPSLTLEEHTNAYVVPWGRVTTEMRQDLLDAMKDKDDGGTGQAEAFWEWCEGHIKEYL